jgi:hypothetical protein
VDKATLIRNDLEIEGRVLAALSLAKIPITLSDLNYVPQLDEWQFIIATPWYDSKGPRESYTRVFKALQDAGVYEDIPTRRLFLKSPTDPLVKALERDLKHKTEGSVHILGDKKFHAQRPYAVIFAPYSGPGGAVPARVFQDLNGLRSFLEDELYISRSSVDETLSELGRRGSASIFNVQLTRRELKRLELVL